MMFGDWGVLTDEAGSILNAKQHGMDAAINAPLNRELRQSMLRGERNPRCLPCWQREDAGLESSREVLNKEFPHMLPQVTQANLGDSVRLDLNQFPIENLDLRLGNNCNLKCKMCSPTESSSWINDWAEWKGANGEKKLDYYGQEIRVLRDGLNWRFADDSTFDWHKDANLLNDVIARAKDIKQIYFTGGEPFINRPHWQLLQALRDSGFAQQIRLQYNTNLTVLPSEAESIWSNFHSVQISCSLDGVGDYAEYLRPPSKWDVIVKNVMRLDQSPGFINVSWSPTVSLFNIAHIPEMSLWILRQGLKKTDPKMWLNILNNPIYLSCQTLSLNSKLEVQDRYQKTLQTIQYEFGIQVADKLRLHFQPLLKYMFAEDNSKYLKSFYKHMEALDRVQGKNLEKCLPDVAQLIRL
jgi:organic radical activating enzyme